MNEENLEPLDILLKQIISGFFLMTDVLGAVSKWSEPAEPLFGLRQQHPVVVRALRAALEPQPEPWEGWRAAGTLVAFRPFTSTPWVEEELTRREAERVEKDAAVEERLSDPDPGVRGETIHELDDAAAVVARLLSALERIDELERVAGQFEEARKEVDESKRRADAAEREAAQVRRALSDVKPAGADVELLARLERLERARLDEQQSAFDATKALERAEAARRELATRPEQADAGRAELATRLEQAESARADVILRLSALETGRATTSAEAEIRLSAAQAAADQRADAARTALEERVVELEAARTELTGAAKTRAHADDQITALRRDVAATRTAAETRSGELLDSSRPHARPPSRPEKSVIALRAELETFQAQAEAIRADNAAARDAAAKAAKAVAAGDQRIEAMQSEVAHAVAQIEELKTGLTSAGQAAVIARREAEQARVAAAQAGEGSNENATAVFREILGMAARSGSGSGVRALSPRPSQPQPEKAVREPRHGFDDASHPLAILGLDGKFKELNPSFARLVGYQEHEFAKAAWPSPHDRQVYKQQQEDFRLLVNGEVETVNVQSTYMHGQGLMVPVVGELTLVQGEDGLPSHVLLTAEDRAAHG